MHFISVTLLEHSEFKITQFWCLQLRNVTHTTTIQVNLSATTPSQKLENFAEVKFYCLHTLTDSK